MNRLTIALAGNPNSGKTTIFNNLTGAHQKVGNWPGVTVEKKEAIVKHKGIELKFVDLPGTYSLTPFSLEEIVARDFILNEKPDVVVNIIDSANLERSLYLAMQIMELDRPVVFALNMADLAKSKGVSINGEKLGSLLNLPVIFTVGNKIQGMDLLVDAAVKEARTASKGKVGRRVKYHRDIETLIGEIETAMDRAGLDLENWPGRWTAIKLLENDEVVKKNLGIAVTGDVNDSLNDADNEVLEVAEMARSKIEEQFQDDPEIVLTDERYGFIEGIVKDVVTVTARKRADISRSIDRVLTNRLLGFPIFVFFIWAMFQMTFSFGAYPMEWIESGVGLFSSFLNSMLPPGLFKDLILDGIVAGIGSVIVFLPNILILFFCISLFEDTGYMARTAFLMDRIMHTVGLHGKSFIPMLMGFGCSVPAIMATKALENRKDRILTILITPFMSCSAKLPVYIILAGSFFAHRAGTVIFGLYVTGIVTAILSGRLFRSTLLRGEDAPFVMELPPYRVPMVKSLMIHMWDRSRMFLQKMGGVILVGSIIIWAFSTFPRDASVVNEYSKSLDQVATQRSEILAQVGIDNRGDLLNEADLRLADLERKRDKALVERSIIGRIGHFIEPVFSPIGIDWRGGVALVTGLVAKEVVVSTMGVLYGVGDDEANALDRALHASGMTALSALSMMVFVLLYVPCIATVTTIWREASAGWAFFSLFYTTSVAWCLSFLVYQGGKLLGFG